MITPSGEKDSDIMCPICGNGLKELRFWDIVYDGNTVFQCCNEEHRFFTNPMSRDILFLNKKATQSNFKFERAWKMVNYQYEEIFEKCLDRI